MKRQKMSAESLLEELVIKILFRKDSLKRR